MSVLDFIFGNFGNMFVTIFLCVYFHTQILRRREFEQELLKSLRDLIEKLGQKQ